MSIKPIALFRRSEQTFPVLSGPVILHNHLSTPVVPSTQQNTYFSDRNPKGLPMQFMIDLLWRVVHGVATVTAKTNSGVAPFTTGSGPEQL
jgi:hypothetical protein